MGGVEFAGADGAQEDVFGGVLGIDQLERRRFVAVSLEQLETQSIGRRVAELLAEHTVLGDKGKLGAIERLIERVVTAGSGEDDVGIPCHRLFQHEIGRCITGVERDNKMHLFGNVIG